MRVKSGSYSVEETISTQDRGRYRGQLLGFGVWWHGPSGETRIKVRGFSVIRLGADVALSNANALRDELNAKIPHNRQK